MCGRFLVLFLLCAQSQIRADPIHNSDAPEDEIDDVINYGMTSALQYGDVTDTEHTYVSLGDVNLGAVFSIHK